MAVTPADPSKVAQLVDMGLTTAEAIQALERAQNDLERALTLHFDPSSSSPMDNSMALVPLGTSVPIPALPPSPPKPGSCDDDMSRAIALSLQSLSPGKVQHEAPPVVIPDFQARQTNLTKENGMPMGIYNIPEWPALSCVLLALFHMPPFTALLNTEEASAWGNPNKTQQDSQDGLTHELKNLFVLLKFGQRKYSSPAGVANKLRSLNPGLRLPKSVPETLEWIKNALIKESPVDKGSKFKKLLSVPVTKDSTVLTDYSSSIKMPMFYIDEDLREWLAGSLSSPKTYLFPDSSSTKLLVLDFPEEASLRVPQELYVDRHLKRNAMVLVNKEKERRIIQQELTRIESKKDLYPHKTLQTLKATAEFLSKRTDLAPPSLSQKLMAYYDTQRQKLKEIDGQAQAVKRRLSDVFEVSALLKEKLKIFAIFTDSSVYICSKDAYIRFSNGHPEKLAGDVLDAFLDSSVDSISSLWYQSGMDEDLISLEEAAPDWILDDNEALEKETQMDLL